MSRKLIALFVSTTIALANVSTAAWSAPASAPLKASAVQAAKAESKNVPPLTPAGAAGIRQAQGSGGNELYYIGGFVAVFGLLWLIDSGNGDDDDNNSSGTGTN